jgi:hypothetical protein
MIYFRFSWVKAYTSPQYNLTLTWTDDNIWFHLLPSWLISATVIENYISSNISRTSNLNVHKTRITYRKLRVTKWKKYWILICNSQSSCVRWLYIMNLVYAFKSIRRFSYCCGNQKSHMTIFDNEEIFSVEGPKSIEIYFTTVCNF